jgi:hypothetical protein
MFITLPPGFGRSLTRKTRGRRGPHATKVTRETLLIEWAESLGYTGDPNDLQAMADYVWATGNRDARWTVEQLVADGVITAPW